MKISTINNLKRAFKETTLYFLVPLLVFMALGKGLAEYAMWTHEVSKASGWSGMQTIALYLAPIAFVITIAATGIFYWINTKDTARFE